jgi:transcriptional regulator with XRE-family HTH domain
MERKSFKQLFEEAEKHDDYWISELILDFTDDLYRAMKKKNIKKSELATKLGTSPAYITKVLRGDVNFTLKTMFRLAKAVGENFDVHLGLQRREIQYVYIDVPQNVAAWAPTTAITAQNLYGQISARLGANIACTTRTGHRVLDLSHRGHLHGVVGVGRAVPEIQGTAANKTEFMPMGGY